MAAQSSSGMNLPQFGPSCFTPGVTNVEDIANYKLTSWNPASVGESAQTDWQGAASAGHLYHAGGKAGSVEFGGKYRDAHQYNDSYTTTYSVAKGVTVPIAPFGLLQAGYFYKHLTNPIIATQTRRTSGPFAGFLVSQPGNAGSAICITAAVSGHGKCISRSHSRPDGAETDPRTLDLTA